MRRTSRARRTQRGNILFIILLAVVLFAALNYAVTSSMREGGNDASSEKYKTQVSDIIQFLGLVDNAVMRMQISNSLKPESISFVYDMPRQDGTISPAGHNGSCTNTLCRVVSVRARGVISGVGDGVFRGGACPTPECGVAGGHRVHRYGGVCTLQP